MTKSHRPTYVSIDAVSGSAVEDALIAWLTMSALAAPPRVEVIGGWSGNASGSYGYATVQAPLARSERVGLLARATASHLSYSYDDAGETIRVDAPGISLGPLLVLTPPGDFAFGIGAGITGRYADTVKMDGVVTGDAFWRPGQRASLYGQVAAGVLDGSLWGRLGGTYPVTPRERPVALWLGAEVTTVGLPASLVTEVGPVAEVPIRALRGSLSVRASAPVRDLGGDGLAWERTTLGAGLYWAW